ncbi:MAG TPA: Rieske 2Fe-2S domain-containing protein [Acidimicrobiales bacterium]|nr:Rieske 2Fe-2S domain-containing protein [Acidimicrobiales bacterium]
MLSTPLAAGESAPPVVQAPGPAPDLALLPLRVFLGGTFAFAGLQKLASATYLDPSSRSGVAAQMHAASTTSPLSGLLDAASHHAVPLGLAIALGELAVGIGTLLGLWTRAAAIGGMALSLAFLLAVSWHSNPYYLGPDIVFLLAFTPFAIGRPSRWSVDAAVSRRLQLDRPPPGADAGRRRFLETASVAGWVALVGLVGAGTAAALGRLVGDMSTSTGRPVTLRPPAPSTSSAASTGAPETSSGAATSTTAAGTAVGQAADVPVGGSALFRDPVSGSEAIVVQPKVGTFEACSAACTHEGCTVRYTGSVLHCPCHGAEFDPATGAVLRGPANRPLETLTIRPLADGILYVDP